MPRLVQFSVFLLVMLAVLGGMHFYLWARLVRDPDLAEPWRRLLTAGLVVAAVTVPASILLMRSRPSRLAQAFSFVGMTWLGTSFLLFSALLATDLVRLFVAGSAAVRDWMRHAPEVPVDPERRQLLARAVAGGATLAVGGASAFAMRSALADPEIHEVPVRLERLPRRLSGLSIAQITDLHIGPTIGEPAVRRVVQAANALKPDLVAITGDLVDGSVTGLGRAVAELGALRARYGVLFVTGNHEYYSGVEPWLAFLRQLGFRVLRNERVSIGEGDASLDVAGIDDWRSRGLAPGHGPDLGKALAGRDPDRSLLLLAHQPRGVEEAVRSGVELQLSGHTHGGQIFPFTLLTGLVYPYLRGLYRLEEGGREGQVFVSRGTGYWGPPMRLGNPPEIARIVLT
ncbi:MAG TPA: metallophosphoesterase [Anaeromyxobacteraceae bacterium]|nr:metallophosphoesterase [Anaeromyxobacteraceae bacterium]